MKKTILLTGCGGHFMADIINCYRHIPGVESTIIGVASETNPELYDILDVYIQVPRCEDSDYYARLLSICKEYAVDILIPGLDMELVPLRYMKDRFEEIGTIVSVSDGKGLDVATNKLKFLKFIELCGIPHPEFMEFRDAEELNNALIEMGGKEKPVCVKALDRAGSRGFRILDPTIDYLDKFLDEKPSGRTMSPFAFYKMYTDSKKNFKPKMMIQEYLPGREYSVDLVAEDGKVLYMVGRLNTVVDNSIPLESVLEADPFAYEISEEIVKFLNLSGNVGIDFIYNAEGQPIPIEVNARITATIALCAAGGINLAALQVMRLLNLPLPNVAVKYGTRVVKRVRPTYFDPEGGYIHE